MTRKELQKITAVFQMMKTIAFGFLEHTALSCSRYNFDPHAVIILLQDLCVSVCFPNAKHI